MPIVLWTDALVFLLIACGNVASLLLARGADKTLRDKQGKKMSKSLGNFFTVRDLLDPRVPGEQGWPGEVIRMVMLGTQFKKYLFVTVSRRPDRFNDP